MVKRGENPDAVASMMAQVNSLPTSRVSRHEHAIPINLDVFPGAYGAIMQAAKTRRISVASYVRRAALALAAHDLNLSLRELVEVDPRMHRDTNMPIDDPDGRRFGAWEIESLFPEFQ